MGLGLAYCSMGDLDFVVVDFETTGLEADAQPVEVGMVKVIQGDIVAQFETLIFQERVGEGATKIHGLKASDLSGAPKIADLTGAFANFVGEHPILMHNAAFDLRIAKNAGLLKTIRSNKVYCSLHLSKQTLDTPNHKLSTLAHELGLKHQPAHRSISDALATAELVLTILEIERFDSLHNLYANRGLWPGLVQQGDYKLPRNGSKQSAHLNASIRNSIRQSIAEGEWILHPEWVGQEVCFTGKLSSMERAEAQLLAMRMGAEPKTSVNKRTSIVIVGEEKGDTKLAKIQKWRSKGSRILELDEEQFIGCIEEAQLMQISN